MVKGEVGNPQVSKGHYFQAEYDTKERFVSYWHQIDELRTLSDGDILEVGSGNQFVADYLRKRGYSVTTMDIDPELDVDLIGSVTEIPCDENRFSVGACFEVLEHMPYEEALQGLQELGRVSRNYVVFSVPDYEHAFWGNIRLPIIGKVKWFFSFARAIPYKEPQVEDQHFWEIGMKEYSAHQVKEDVKDLGFKIVRTYRHSEDDKHRFFVIKCNQ